MIMKKLIQNLLAVYNEIAACICILKQLRNFRNEDFDVL